MLFHPAHLHIIHDQADTTGPVSVGLAGGPDAGDDA